MTVQKLLAIVFAIAVTAGALGVLSLDAQVHALRCGAGESASAAPSAEAPPLDAGAFLVAELVREGDEMLLFPQTGDVIRSHGSTLVEGDGPYLFQDGKLYAWVKGDKRRVWLFGVIAEEKPSVQVAADGPTRSAQPTRF